MKQMAEDLLYSQGYLSSVVRGKKVPSKRFIHDVAIYTDGIVSEEDLCCVKECERNEEKENSGGDTQFSFS